METTTRPNGARAWLLVVIPALTLVLLLPALIAQAGPPPAAGQIGNLAVLQSLDAGEHRTPPVLVRAPAYLPETGGEQELWPLLLLFGCIAVGSGLWRQYLVWQLRRRARGDS